MLFENPFFLRDYRRCRGFWQRYRRGLVPVSALFLLGFALLVWQARRLAGPEAASVVWPICGLEALACALVAGNAGRGVLDDEERGGTLEALRLLPAPPREWLRWKLDYPLAVLLLAAGLALAADPVLVLAGIGAPADWLPIALIPLGTGLLTLGSVLCTARELGTLRHPAEPQPLRRRSLEEILREDSGSLLLMGGLLLPWLLALWGFLASMSGREPEAATPLRAALWPGGALLIGQAAFASAVARVDGTASTDRRAVRVRLAVLALLVLVPLAVFVLPEALRGDGRSAAGLLHFLGLLAFATALTLFVLPVRLPALDALGRADLDWIARYGPNPVFLRDLRADLRGICPRLSLAALLLASLALGSLASAVNAPAEPGAAASLAELGRGAATFLGFMAPLGLLLRASFRASRQWERELREGVGTGLLLTPLESGRLVRGRLAAALLGTGLAHPGALAVVAVSVARAMVWNAGVALPVLLIFVSIAACLLFHTTHGLSRSNWGCVGLLILFLTVSLTLVGLFLLWREPDLAAAGCLALAAVPPHVTLAWAGYRAQVHTLDEVRSGGPESEHHCAAQLSRTRIPGSL